MSFLIENSSGFDTLKSSLIPFKNTKFIITTSITTIPFLCFLIFYETILQKTFLETSNFLQTPHNHYTVFSYDDWRPFNETKNMTKFLFPRLIKLLLLYVLPYHVIELFSIVTIVDLVSKLFYFENNQASSIKDLIKKSIQNVSRTYKVCFITSWYVMLLSTCCLLGLLWIVANYIILSGESTSFYDTWDFFPYYYHSWGGFFIKVLSFLLHGLAFLALLVKYMEWSANWNMAIVISILEDGEGDDHHVYGSEALELSNYYGRFHKKIGCYVMLFIFIWCLILRLPCLLVFGCCSHGIGGLIFTLFYVSLICLGNVVKWIFCVFYFFDCKKTTLEKKVDEETGREEPKQAADA